MLKFKRVAVFYQSAKLKLLSKKESFKQFAQDALKWQFALQALLFMTQLYHYIMIPLLISLRPPITLYIVLLEIIFFIMFVVDLLLTVQKLRNIIQMRTKVLPEQFSPFCVEDGGEKILWEHISK